MTVGQTDDCGKPLLPLVVDLDGTLTPTDTLVESVLTMARQDPVALLGIPTALLRGRAAFKEFIAARTSLCADDLPFRQDLMAFLREQRALGRRIVLATAAHISISQRVAARVELFDDVLATESGVNLKGVAKLRAIRARVGERFVYAGDSKADLPIWQAAEAAILVNVPAGLAARVRKTTPVEREFQAERAGLRTWLRALRVHQWLKNVLLFVPLITAASGVGLGQIMALVVAFLSFSLLASATYLANDLWDLAHDRSHPRKRHRALAAGTIAPAKAMRVGLLLAIAAAAMALGVSTAFAGMLLVYFVLTTAYSAFLKTHALLDVLTLAVLYTIRILAGAIVLGVSMTPWLLAFSAFLFFSLALVKRCSELVSLSREGRNAASGRDYRVDDLSVLWPMGVSSAMSSVVVMGLFISVPTTQARYASPDLLWLVALALTYWVSRIWVKTARGEMHDDPLVFAIADRGCRWTVVVMIICTLLSRFLFLGPR